MPTHSHKRKTSYRLSERARELLDRLKEKLGVTETGVIEIALRRMALVELSETGWPAATILDAAASLLKRPDRAV